MSTSRAPKRTLSPSLARGEYLADGPAVEGTPVIPTEPPAKRIKVPDVKGADPTETEVTTTTKTKYTHRPPTDSTGTQTDESRTHVPDEAKPPSTTGRSHIEVTVTAHLLEALFGTASATLQALWATLRRGDAMERSDAAFELTDGLVVLFEWDGGAHAPCPYRLVHG
jgi:hypothetical protein